MNHIMQHHMTLKHQDMCGAFLERYSTISYEIQYSACIMLLMIYKTNYRSE